MKTLTRDEILSADDIKSERVKVPEWGGEVIVRELSGTERDAWETSVLKTVGDQLEVNAVNIRAKLAAASIVDETGKRLFNAKDIADLGKKSASALDRVTDVAKRLSRIGEDQLESLGKRSGRIKLAGSASR